MKGCSVQHSFLPMLEKYKKAEDNGSVCPSNDLILAKLDSYGIKISALKLIHDYLAKRKKKLVIFIVHGGIYSLAYIKDQYCVQLFLTSFKAIFF